MEERERRQLAQDLHDGLGQTLTLAIMRLGMLEWRLAPAEREALAQVEKLLCEAQQSSTSLSFRLSPPVLYDVGFVTGDLGLGSAAPGRGLLEGVEVHHDEVDRLDARLAHVARVALVVGPRQDAPVEGGVQRLDAAVHHFWKSREIRNARHFERGIGEDSRSAARRNELEGAVGERPPEVNEAGLVGNA